MSTPNVFLPPAGTRDLYPADFARLRHITDTWRLAALRHGFDEIAGPVIEHADLYAHSGDGVHQDLFAVKPPLDTPDSAPALALRPEFTPTLARMFAARAAELPAPTRWTSQTTCFRAERPQRGRMREFLQWNCDILADDSPRADAEVIAVAVHALRALGLTPEQVKVRISHRGAVETLLRARGVPIDRLPQWFFLLDRAGKISNDDFTAAAVSLGMHAAAAIDLLRIMALTTPFEAPTTQTMLSEVASGRGPAYFKALFAELKAAGVDDWCVLNLGIVRGLSYYSALVFEIHAVSGKDRAIAGGGRYDNLVHHLGGPTTPAVGFAMGDAVLSLLLAEHNLFPTDAALAERLALRPDILIIADPASTDPAAISSLVATLRRANLHVRRSADSDDLLTQLQAAESDASPLTRPRFIAIVESSAFPGRAILRSLDANHQHPTPLSFAEIPSFVTG